MDHRRKILMDNFVEYYNYGSDALSKRKYNVATTLFFKSIVSLIDLFILKKEGFVPSSHSDRFQVLREKYDEIYDIVDRDFPFYQDSYTKKMDKETAQLLREDADAIKKTLK